MKFAVFAIVGLLAAFASANPVDDDSERIDPLPVGAQRLYQSTFLERKVVQTRGVASWSKCGGDDSVTVYDISIPSPLTIPGNHTISIDFEINKDIANFALDLTLERKTGIWINIPCVDGVGSCYYEDFCTKISKRFPDPANPPAGVCPFTAARHTSVLPVSIPPAPSSLESLITGNYRATAKFYQFPAPTFNKKLIYCLKIENLSLQVV